MLAKLLLLLIVVPLVELVVLLWIADRTTWQFTLALVVLTGVIGALLARWQGWHTFQRIQRQMQSGQLPADALLDALMILVAGLLLMTPGVLTDLLGFSLLTPICRYFYKRWIIARLKVRFRVRTTDGGADDKASSDDRVIDSYVVRRDDHDESQSGSVE